LILVLQLITLINLPYVIKYAFSGRLRQGWMLNRNDKLNEITLDGRVSGNFIEKKLSKNQSSLYVKYNYWHNKLTLQLVWRCNSLTVIRLMVMILYTAIIAVALIWNNTHLQVFIRNFRRPAKVAMAQWPILFLLSMKNNIFSIIGLSYEQLNFLHRLIGKLIVICASIHAGLILNAQVAPLNALLGDLQFLYGLVSLSIIILITLSSFGPIRKRIYQIFLGIHVIGYPALIFALWRHAPFTHIWIIIAAGCAITDGLLKICKTRWKSAHFTSLPGSVTMVEVTRTGTGWRAGQHVYLRVFSAKYIFEKHPFTIANAPANDTPYGSSNTLILVSKSHGDYTRRIHQIGLTKAAFEADYSEAQIKSPAGSESSILGPSYDSQMVVSIEGPYGSMFVDMPTYETAILIASGVAFTFIVSLFEEIVGSALRGKTVTKIVYIVWTLRDSDMIEAFINPVQETLRVARAMNIAVVIRVHVTSTIGTYIPPHMPELCIIPSRADIQKVIFLAVDDTVAEIYAGGISNNAQGIGIAVSTGSLSLSKAVQDAALKIDSETFGKIGGVRVH
ncbi:hypothetical protein BY996DRAFT_8436521, partial [Phakopsora pachyrhizi]